MSASTVRNIKKKKENLTNIGAIRKGDPKKDPDKHRCLVAQRI